MVRLTRSTAVILFGLFSKPYFVNAQFTIYDNSTLLDDTLGEECLAALTATIECTPYVQEFQRLAYRWELDVELTDAICTQDCFSSLKSWFDSVAVKCAGKSVSDGVPTRYGGYMWAGYNETCVKDPRPPRAYCNSMSITTHKNHLRRHANHKAPQMSLPTSPQWTASKSCLARSCVTLAKLVDSQ
jgi:hypothetical protein